MQRLAFLAGALLAAALLAPTALAQRPDDRDGRIGVGSVTTPAAVAAHSVLRPDDRPGIRAPGPGPVAASTVVVSSDGFDWNDAGIGVAGGLGLALVAGGLLASAMRRHRVHRLA
jgi:hypothetical protein